MNIAVKLCLIFALFLALAGHVRCDPNPANVSYGELALALVPAQWQRILDSLPRYSNTSCISDSSTRYVLVEFREYFAVFTFAYPLIDPKGFDLFRLVWQDISEGYQLIGKCWDVSKINHTPEQLAQASKVVYTWKLQFAKNLQRYNYTTYVQNPSTTQLYYRRPSQLSYQYWGSSKYFPLQDISALQNLARLVRGQFETLLDWAPGIFNLSSVWEEDQHERFHDYRKLARYATYLIDPNPPDASFPEVLTRSVNTQINFSWQLQHEMGRLNDLIVGYHLYESFGNKTLAEERLNTIKRQYPLLQEYAAKGDWLGTLQFILDSLIK